jgi:hypothetical protein
MAAASGLFDSRDMQMETMIATAARPRRAMRVPEPDTAAAKKCRTCLR